MQRVALVIAFAIGAYSQISAIPPCALSPAIAAVGQTGCSTTDYACMCGKQDFASSLYSQVQAACSASDLQQAVSAIEVLCSQAGVPVTIRVGTSTSAPSINTAAEAAVRANTAAAAPAGMVTQIGDGQIQSPTNVTNHVSVASGFAAPAASSNVTTPVAPKNATNTVAVSYTTYTGGASSLLGGLSSLVVLAVPFVLFF